MRRRAPAAAALLGVVAGSLEKAHTLSGAAAHFFPSVGHDLVEAAHLFTVVTGDLSEMALVVIFLPSISQMLRKLAGALEAFHGGVVDMVESIVRKVVAARIRLLQALLWAAQRIAVALQRRITALSGGARPPRSAVKRSASQNGRPRPTLRNPAPEAVHRG